MVGPVPILTTTRRGNSPAAVFLNGLISTPLERNDFVKTVDELKQEFVEHIATLDKSEMSMYDLSNYADLLRKADELFAPSYAEMIANGAFAPFGGNQRKE
uniref:Uncharacterized protein n=1 Tax=Siphoviridae sp. ctVCm11 TaxID=2826358 RepID=A0A8S5QM64_9CAUD|nr:MAG TPA: hypothetical protein [Siphoviridae sp. ctVCm11]